MDNNLTGVTAEMIFRSECLKRKIIPSIPDVDIKGYDAICQYDKTLYRVQIKCTNSMRGDGYRVSCGRGSKGKSVYTKSDIDYFAIYIPDRDYWYIIPVEEIKAVCITLFPDKLNHKYSKYLSSWHLLAS